MIPLFKPSFGKEELEALKEPFETGWIGLGPKTQEFEKEFAKYVKAKVAIGTNSCTAALHLSLKLFDIEGGEVILPSLSFVSTAHAVLYNGGIPVFADIEEDTLCLNPEDVGKKINSKTKAIIPMHYGGHPCDMDGILKLASDEEIKVIDDAAHACGAEYKGRKIGSLTDATCFSFQAIKNLSTGEGGMITSNSEELRDKIKQLRWLGIDRETWERTSTDENKYSWQYDVEALGFKYHMSDIQAAIGLVQLRKLDRLNEKRREITAIYNEAFSKLEWIQPPVERDYARSAMHNYVVKIALDRERFMQHLSNNGIACSVHYLPIHLFSFYKKYTAEVPITEKVWKRLVTLPLYPDLKDEEIEKIITTVKGFKT